jgi:hypothetical protein
MLATVKKEEAPVLSYFEGCGEKVDYLVILSEAKNLPWFCANEKKERFFASLRMTKVPGFRRPGLQPRQKVSTGKVF